MDLNLKRPYIIRPFTGATFYRFQADLIRKVWKEISEEEAEEERAQTQTSRTTVGVACGGIIYEPEGKQKTAPKFEITYCKIKYLFLNCLKFL